MTNDDKLTDAPSWLIFWISFGFLWLCFCLVFNSFTWSLIYYVIISVIDLYLFLVLFSAANKSDKRFTDENWRNKILPTKTMGLFIFAFLLGVAVLAYAGLFLACGNEFKELINQPIDAIYFSFTNIITMGLGDNAPTETGSKIIIMWQFGTGILLIAGAFGLLISKLSDYKI